MNSIGFKSVWMHTRGNIPISWSKGGRERQADRRKNRQGCTRRHEDGEGDTDVTDYVVGNYIELERERKREKRHKDTKR